jgi:3',5'-cyclic AMP phosphodiesterase CpdA
MLSVLHLSDLHFGSTPAIGVVASTLEEIAALFMEEAAESESRVIVLSGDITSKGEATPYVDAGQALARLRDAVQPDHVVCCPGNHDINLASPRDHRFDNFNRFCLSLTNDHRQLAGGRSSASLIEILPGLDFVIANSSHHEDPAYGEVQIEDLQRTLTASSAETKLLVLHHPVVSSSTSGPGIRNAAELLAVSASAGVSAILHGHGHGELLVRFGDRAPVLGVGSVFFPPNRNLNNQFAVYKVSQGEVMTASIYRQLADRGPSSPFVPSPMAGP